MQACLSQVASDFITKKEKFANNTAANIKSRHYYKTGQLHFLLIATYFSRHILQELLTNFGLIIKSFCIEIWGNKCNQHV